MAAIIIGKRSWRASRDEQGHRTYTLVTEVGTSANTDGPYIVMNAVTVAHAIGSTWNFGSGEVDQWAYCLPSMQVEPHPQKKEGDADRWWLVTQTFSTKPPDSAKCQTSAVGDPLLEPAVITIGGVRYTEAASEDRFGNPIVNSVFERINGPLVEFDASRLTVRIRQNVGTNTQAYILPAQMMDMVNGAALWGLPARCIKLNPPDVEIKYQGLCTPYYQRTLTFDVFVKKDENGNLTSGFDRRINDEGDRMLKGHWAGNGVYVLDRVGVLAPPVLTSATPTSLAAGVVRYGVTAVDSGSGETTLSNTIELPVGSDFDGTTVTWRPVDGATSYQVYRYTTANPSYLLVATVSSPTLTWTDTGVAGSGTPPVTNGTGGIGSPANPQHLIGARNSDNRPARIPLNGAGLPAGATIGTPVTVVATTTPIIGGYTVINQPLTTASRLNLTIVDTDVSISGESILTIAGTDINGFAITEQIQFGGGGSASYLSQLEYKSVTNVASTLDATSTTGDTLTLATAQYTTQQGVIVVQKYNDADFTLLGIPTSF